jgi:hypothetical protein
MDKFVRFEMGDRLVCIKEYESLKVGSHYQIKGCGDLTWNSAANKDGYGFCIEDDQYGYHSGRKDWWNLPYNEKIKWYYFTEQEMSEYFISEQEDYKAHLRNEKIVSLGI